MKKLSFAILLSVLSLQTAFAKSSESVEVNPQTVRSLPKVSVLGVTVNPGPAMAAVQPTAHIQFLYRSCATQFFKAQVEEKENVLFVTLDLPETALDCMGPQISREYSVQISSDFLNQQVVVLNPVDIFMAK